VYIRLGCVLIKTGECSALPVFLADLAYSRNNTLPGLCGAGEVILSSVSRKRANGAILTITELRGCEWSPLLCAWSKHRLVLYVWLLWHQGPLRSYTYAHSLAGSPACAIAPLRHCTTSTPLVLHLGTASPATVHATPLPRVTVVSCSLGTD